MIDLKRPRLSVVRQCALLQFNRSSVYYRPVPESEAHLELMRLIDAQFLEAPYYGSRQMMRHLCRLGHDVGRKRVGSLMAMMGGRNQGSVGSADGMFLEGRGRSIRSHARRYRIQQIGNILIFCGIW